MALILSFGPELRVTGASDTRTTTVTSFVVGMYDEPALTEHDGLGHGVQIDLTTAGAYALLGGSLGDLSNRVAHVDDVCEVDTDRLVDRLLATDDHACRLAILDEELASAIAAGPRLSPEIAWADHQLRASGGRIRIGALAADLGWSGSRMVDRFRHEVGLAPKALARVLRFRQTTEILAREHAGASLARLAADCGYADQSHFNREFRAFAGCTPTEFLAREHAGASLARLAADCGYADQSHFNREFRAFAGCTPTEFLADLATG
jgi:AraC-like DNA-binding protein